MKNLVLAIIVSSFLFDACRKDEYPKTVDIEYKVGTDSGVTGIASVRYCNESGENVLLYSVALPFAVSVKRTVNKNDTIFLNALNSDSITEHLEIDINGSQVAEDIATPGPFAYGEIEYVFP